MVSWWKWDGSRKIAGGDWNDARDVTIHVTEGHDHDGVDSKGVPQKVDSLPTPDSERYGTMAYLTTDKHIYVCVPV